LVSNFKSHYQARTHVVAIAPLANDSGNPEGAVGARAIREAIYRELIERRDDYTVTIQDLTETDRRIHDSGLPDSSASRISPIDLCKRIGADAVLEGSLTRYEKMALSGGFGDYAAALFKTVNSEVNVKTTIFDGVDGKQILQRNVEKTGDLIHAPQDLYNAVGSEAAKKFPYRK